MSYQSLTLIGNVGNVQPLRELDGDRKVLNFSLAVNERYGDNETTTWFRCAVWNRMAEALAPYIVTGKQLHISGSLVPDENGSPRVYEANDGSHRASYEVRVRDLTLLGRKGDGEGSAPAQDAGDIPF